jgi:hypothetical protein
MTYVETHKIGADEHCLFFSFNGFEGLFFEVGAVGTVVDCLHERGPSMPNLR